MSARVPCGAPPEGMIPAIVRCTWVDAHSIDEWTCRGELEEESEPALIESVGYLVLDRPDRIVLANSIDPDAAYDVGYAACAIVIPRKYMVDEPVVVAPARKKD